MLKLIHVLEVYNILSYVTIEKLEFWIYLNSYSIFIIINIHFNSSIHIFFYVIYNNINTIIKYKYMVII